MKTSSKYLLIALLFITPTLLFGQTEVEINGKGNQTHTYRSNTGVTSTDLEYRGKIIFTDDETDVKYISPGGFLKFSKRSFGNKRTIELEGESNGQFTRTYREGSSKVDFEPEGRKWMASVLPEIIRTTGIGAEERVNKFYKKGGINAVLDEIENLPSNYVQSKYYTAVFNMANLSNSDISKTLNHASRELNSSYEQSKVLRENSELFAKNEENMRAAIKFVEEINSSYEQSKVYIHFLKEEDLSEQNKTLIIAGVRKVSSSYEQSKILQAMLKDDLSTANIEMVIAETAYINSTYEQGKILRYVVDNQETEDLDFDVMVKAIGAISSSYEQSKALKRLVDTRDLTTAQIIKVTKAATYINSDYEQSKLLQTIISNQKLDKESVDAILIATADVSSSYEKSKILQLIANSNNFTSSNYSTLIEYSDGISSSYDQSKVLSLLAKKDDLSDGDQLKLIEAIDDISSNYEKAKLLTLLAPNLSANNEVREAFMISAKGLSDSDYGKLMKSLNY